MEKYYIGVDIGGTSAKIGLFSTEKDDIVKTWSVPTLKSSDEMIIINSITESIKEQCAAYSIEVNELVGIGIGVPGPVTEEGLVLKCANLGWDVVDLRGIVSNLTGVQNVCVANDANVAALGEVWRGSGKEYGSIVMVTLGTGVGGGIIINERIHTGYAGAAGEIGHLTVNADETEHCGCGARGCLEQYASATGVVRLAKQLFPEKYGKELTAKDIFDEAKAGDEKALVIVDEFARYLGIALSGVAKVVAPQAFVIGGGVAAAGNIIIDTVKKYYDEYSLFALKNLPIVLASLGNSAGMYGSVRMVKR